MGTPFIIIIFAIIFVCVAIAVIVAALMRANNELGGEETEQVHAPGSPADDPHDTTGPLPPFMPLPHQTQPLSEIYYYNEQAPTPQPYVPLPLSDTPIPPTSSDLPVARSEAPPMPPVEPGYQQLDQ